ncbi:MAG TPA: hypothetical protein VNN07_07775, partial [Candidatus Tectomicrobia bacterium]|nr:hypothetical protein [Candidatus Tectomicrobia bacterium]
RARLEEALALAGELELRPLVGHAHLALAALARRAGAPGEAASHLEQATALYRAMGLTYWLEQAEAERKASA